MPSGPAPTPASACADSGIDRDLVAEFVDACRSEGLRVGFYLSLSDWHHPDYPAFRDEDRPYPFIAYPRPEPEVWARYVDDLFGQVRELLTDYGEIAVLWFDGGWERAATEWKAAELEALIRELQPDILLNERLPSVADYTTPEQFVPPTAPEGRWETCLTMNESWGYVPDDEDWKSARDLVHALCETVGKGGNLLLNVGPRGDGSLDPTEASRLSAVADWMDRYGSAVHDVEAGLEPWQWYGPSTRQGDRVHLMCVQRPYDSVTVRGIPTKRVERVIDLATGKELEWTHPLLGARRALQQRPPRRGPHRGPRSRRRRPGDRPRPRPEPRLSPQPDDRPRSRSARTSWTARQDRATMSGLVSR